MPVFELVDHTGEVEMRLMAGTRAGVYIEAVRGLVAEVHDTDAPPGNERRTIEIGSSGPATLLADLLNEVVFLMETEGFVPSRLDIAELGETTLRGTLVGRSGSGVRPLVKAATYHDLAVWPDGATWHGRVVLDV